MRLRSFGVAFADIERMRILYFLLIAFAPFFSHVEASSFGARKVGIELEFTGVGEAADYTNMKNHQWLLERVKEQFGGGEINIKPWDKYVNSAGSYCATMKDGLGRVWTVAPELMSPGIFDGYELITPPLNSKDDGPKLKRLLSSIEQSDKFVKGWSSSAHYTYDISDLVTKDGNVSKVVDLILYLESHVQEIYTTIKPERYNQTVNRFSVPLAVNQQRLLKELSLLPPFDRTYDRVRNLFNKYYQTELQLNGGQAVSAWKYRAVNYGKFFALGEFKKPIPVVEFRIADLVGPGNILTTGDFYSRLIELGSRASSQPFENKLPNFQSQVQMDTFVKSNSATKYQMFLKEIGMKSSDLPKKIHDFSKSVCTAVFM